MSSRAEEILDYCAEYLSNKDGLELEEFKKTKLYGDMVREIDFIAEGVFEDD